MPDQNNVEATGKTKYAAYGWRDRYLESRALGEFASIRGRYA